MTIEAKQPNGDRWTYEALCLAPNADLENVMRLGGRPDLSKLSGWEFRGFNTLEPLTLVGIRKFKKGFYREDPGRPYDQGIQGYNLPILPNNLGEPWIVKGDSAKAKFGWYEVGAVDLSDPNNKYPNGILINYGASKKNLAVDPTRLLRDYLVQVYPDNPDLYLGKAYFAFGPVSLFMSFFVLERHNRGDLSA